MNADERKILSSTLGERSCFEAAEGVASTEPDCLIVREVWEVAQDSMTGHAARCVKGVVAGAGVDCEVSTQVEAEEAEEGAGDNSPVVGE